MAILRDYYRPSTINEALSLLGRTDERLVPLAGGAQLVGELETRVDPDIDGVVDLRDLGLNQIAIDDGVCQVGATATLTDLIEHPALASLADGILVRAAKGEGPVNLRNAASIGGLVASAAHDSELYAALLALGATVTTRGPAGESTTPLADLGEIDGLVTSVSIPLIDGRSGLARIAITPSDRPIVAAVAITGDGFERVALCGVADRPVLYGGALDPTGDFKASGEYRRAMAKVVVRRALAEAMG